MRHKSFDITLSNGIKFKLTRNGPGWMASSPHGSEIKLLREADGRIPECYLQEIREALNAFSRDVSEPIADPPKIAEFLLTSFMKPSHAEAVMGDLNEHFALDCEQLGPKRAARLYWARTLRSLWPLLWRAMGKALKWGAVIAAVRRLF
jgi:hypothetical protein